MAFSRSKLKLFNCLERCKKVASLLKSQLDSRRPSFNLRFRNCKASTRTGSNIYTNTPTSGCYSSRKSFNNYHNGAAGLFSVKQNLGCAHAAAHTLSRKFDHYYFHNSGKLILSSTSSKSYSTKVLNQTLNDKGKGSFTKPHCNVGTIGHIDHGKTTLSAAITTVLANKNITDRSKSNKTLAMSYEDIDRAPDEKARGITINACHIGFETSKRSYAHTDCPGHIDYIKNMICGANQMDAAILVVAATDGQMPQTREHLMLANQIGIKHMVVYINKIDLVDNETVELVELEVRDLLNEFGFDGDNAPVVSGSAKCALDGVNHEIGEKSILELCDVLDKYVPDPIRDVDGTLFLPLETAFTVPGRGTVAIGTIEAGILRKGQQIELVGYGRQMNSTVSDVQVFKQSVPTAQAGENVGVLLKGVKPNFIERGMVLSEKGAVKQIDTFEAQVYVLKKSEGGRSKPMTNKYIHQTFSGIWTMNGCVLLDKNAAPLIMPGDTSNVKIWLRKPMVIKQGQQFSMRENQFTSLTGVVTAAAEPHEEQLVGFNYIPKLVTSNMTEAQHSRTSKR